MYLYNNKQFTTAQDLQDEIYRNMSADKKMQVVAGFFSLAKALNPDFLERAYSYEKYLKYGNNRPKKVVDKNSKNIG
jgi:hypothetical protein